MRSIMMIGIGGICRILLLEEIDGGGGYSIPYAGGGGVINWKMGVGGAYSCRYQEIVWISCPTGRLIKKCLISFIFLVLRPSSMRSLV